MNYSIIFPDKCVSYETLVRDLALRIIEIQAKMSKEKRDTLSQRAAYNRYGEANVKRWVNTGKLSIFSKRPGKIEYKICDLERCYSKVQDYL